MSNWQATGCFRYHKGTDFQANKMQKHTDEGEKEGV